MEDTGGGCLGQWHQEEPGQTRGRLQTANDPRARPQRLSANTGAGSVIVTGIPGAGKTSVARALASRATLAAHLETDAFYDLVIAGRIQFSKDSPPNQWWQLDLARQHVRLLARSFAAHGVLPIIDDVIADRTVLRHYREELAGPMRLIMLDPTIETVLARDAARDKQVAQRWAYLAESMRRELFGLGLWIDTTGLDLEQTVSEIERRWDEALLKPRDTMPPIFKEGGRREMPDKGKSKSGAKGGGAKKKAKKKK